MVISCNALRTAGIIPQRLSCCPTCHANPPMIQLYLDENGTEVRELVGNIECEVIGAVCCVVCNHLYDHLGVRRHAVLKELMNTTEAA